MCPPIGGDGSLNGDNLSGSEGLLGQLAEPPSSENKSLKLEVRYRGMLDYLPTWQEMKEFTSSRTQSTIDEIWLLEHPPVYTQGVAGRP